MPMQGPPGPHGHFCPGASHQTPFWPGMRDSPGQEGSRVSRSRELPCGPRSLTSSSKSPDFIWVDRGCPLKPLLPQHRQKPLPCTPSRVALEGRGRVPPVLTLGPGKGHLARAGEWPEPHRGGRARGPTCRAPGQRPLPASLGGGRGRWTPQLVLQFEHLCSEIPGTGSG